MSTQERPFDACIFDLDGTLANTLASIAGFGNETLTAYGLPALPVERYKTLVGNGANVLMDRMLQAVGASFSPEKRREFRQEYDRRYESDPLKLVEPYPGIPALLQQLKEQGMKLGVLSNKPDNMARRLGQALFRALPGQAHGQREGVPTKPDPTAVLAMAADLGVQPDRVLYVGDSGVDMATGKNAGMHPCGVLWGFREEEELREQGAEFLVATAQELFQVATRT